MANGKWRYLPSAIGHLLETMKFQFEDLDLTLREPFVIARDVQTRHRHVLVRVIGDGIEGLGEAAPRAFYGETTETVRACLPLLAQALQDTDPFAVEEAWARMERRLGGNHAAKAAVDMALHDWLGQKLGVPLWRLLGGNPAAAPRTSYTIGIDTPEGMARKAIAARAYPILKVKVGTEDDVARVRAIRSARPEAVLRADANTAWSPRQAVTSLELLAEFGLEFVEQPVAAHDLGGLRFVRERSPVPIFADESCAVLSDVPRVAECVDGIVIKLSKCGGIRPALAMIHAARAHGLAVMLGCMTESSLGITAAAHLAPLADYADLDGHLLLADDPFHGVEVVDGRLVLPAGPGLGVTPKTLLSAEKAGS
jgi:L-alanine-DL-glutamate epimerase-like enolase superfamily enzyme